MSYVLWRSDSPANVTGFDSLPTAYRAMRRAMAACHDRSIEWCLIDARREGEWDTVT